VTLKTRPKNFDQSVKTSYSELAHEDSYGLPQLGIADVLGYVLKLGAWKTYHANTEEDYLDDEVAEDGGNAREVSSRGLKGGSISG
jgi:hypothetical protein